MVGCLSPASPEEPIPRAPSSQEPRLRWALQKQSLRCGFGCEHVEGVADVGPRRGESQIRRDRRQSPAEGPWLHPDSTGDTGGELHLAVCPHWRPGHWACSIAVLLSRSPLWAICPQGPTALGAQAERLGSPEQPVENTDACLRMDTQAWGRGPGDWAEPWHAHQHLTRALPTAGTHLAALPPAHPASAPRRLPEQLESFLVQTPRQLGFFS